MVRKWSPLQQKSLTETVFVKTIWNMDVIDSTHLEMLYLFLQDVNNSKFL